MMVVYGFIEVMDVIFCIIRTRTGFTLGCTEMLYVHLGTTFFSFMLNVWDAHYTKSPHICYGGVLEFEIDN